MIDNYSSGTDTVEENNDPYNWTFEKFKLEFEWEILQLLDE